jgi:DNA-directed RNA polymerase subunit beta'
VRVLRPGDTKLLPGDLVDRGTIDEMNAHMIEEGARPATFQQILLGITKAALETESILSAASFQHTINVLAKAAIEGKTDQLVGLKENVILGKLIPAGTGFRRREMVALDGDGVAESSDFDLSDEALADLLEDDLALDTLAFVDDDDEVAVSGAAPDEDTMTEDDGDGDEEDIVSMDAGDDEELEEGEEEEEEELLDDEEELFDDGDDDADAPADDADHGEADDEDV